MSTASLLTDVYRARDFLAAHRSVDASRIALMGFSLGGRTALWASHLRFEQRYGGGSSRFAAHLAFYPTSCNITLVDEERVQDAPIRIFQGQADVRGRPEPSGSGCANLFVRAVSAEMIGLRENNFIMAAKIDGPASA